MIRTITIFFAWLLLGQATVSAQSKEPDFTSQVRSLPGREALPRFALKTNLLYDLSTTFNLGLELRLSDCLTLDVSGNYNPWTFSDNKKFKRILVQPELRYWTGEAFNGHFFGSHLMYSNFNAGNIKFPLGLFSDLKDYRCRGNAYGLGFSYGYQWILSPRWSIEGSLGLGYMYMDYKRYECKTCGKQTDERSKHYFGPTKLAVSLIYVIK